MNQEIVAWLESGRDYKEGVKLYDRFGSSPTQKRIFRVGGESKRNVSILAFELGKLAKKSVKVVQPKTVEQKKRQVVSVIIPKVEQVGRRPNTPEVDKLRKRVVDMLKVRGNMHAMLEFLPTDDERKESAFNILKMDGEVQEIYDRLAHYDKHGVLPPEKTVKQVPVKDIDAMDTESLIKLQYTLKTYVSRYRKKLERCKPGDASKNQSYLDRYTSELEEVSKRLKR